MATLKQASDGLSKVWKTSKRHEAFYRGGKAEVRDDAKAIYTIYDEKLRLVEISTGNQTTPIDDVDDQDSTEGVVCFCVHPNGDDVVVATQKFFLKHWIISSKRCMKTIRAHNMPILAMTYDATGVLVATGSADRTVRVWDIERGYCTHSFKDHTDIVQNVCFHPDPNRLQLYSTSDDHTIRIYDLIDGRCVATLRDHVSISTAISWTPDGYLMASSGRDKVLNFYELRTFGHVKTIPVMDELEGVVILSESDSRKILVPSSCGSLELTGKKKKGKGGALETAVNGSSVVPPASSHVLVTAGSKGIFYIYHIVFKGKDVSSFTCELLTKISISASTHTTPSIGNTELHAIMGLQYIAKSSEIMVTTADHNLCFYSIVASANNDSIGLGCLSNCRQLVGCNDDILDLVTIPSIINDPLAAGSTNSAEDSRSFSVAVITNSPQVRLMNENFTCQVLDGHQDIVLAADASPDGRWLLTSSKDRTCRVWDLTTRTCCGLGEGHADSVGAVCISQRLATYTSKQAFAVTAGTDKILKRWAISIDALVERSAELTSLTSTLHSAPSSSASKKNTPLLKAVGLKEPLGPLHLVCTHSVRAHDKDVNTVAVSPNDALIASGSQDKSIRLWRSTDLVPVATLTGHKRGVWKVVFSPVDRCLASCSGDRTVRLWSVADYSCLRVFEGHTASVLTVRFVNKGMQMVSGAADGLIRLWTIRTGECENTFDEHSDRVWALAVGPGVGGNGLFFSGGTDSRLLVWKNATEEEEKKRLELAEETLLVEQRLQNDIRNKRFDKALDAALLLGHSNKVLGIMTSILEEDAENCPTPDGTGDNAGRALKNIDPLINSMTEPILSRQFSDKLDAYVRKFGVIEIEKVVSYMKEWNTNAKYSFTSQVLLNSLVRVVKCEKLLSSKIVAEALPGLLAYSERHFQRLDRLHQATYVLEYMSSLMHLLPIAEDLTSIADRSSENVSKKRTLDDDEIPVLFAPVKESGDVKAKTKKQKSRNS